MNASDGSDGKAYGLIQSLSREHHPSNGGILMEGKKYQNIKGKKDHERERRGKNKKRKKEKFYLILILPSFALQFLSYFIINFFDDSRTEPGTCWSTYHATSALSLPFFDERTDMAGYLKTHRKTLIS